MDGYHFSKHAKEQMVSRQISLQMVLSVLTDPQQTLTESGKKICQSIINFEEGRSFLVRVIVNVEETPHKVITVYRTSKISKYYEG